MFGKRKIFVNASSKEDEGFGDEMQLKSEIEVSKSLCYRDY